MIRSGDVIFLVPSQEMATRAGEIDADIQAVVSQLTEIAQHMFVMNVKDVRLALNR